MCSPAQKAWHRPGKLTLVTWPAVRSWPGRRHPCSPCLRWALPMVTRELAMLTSVATTVPSWTICRTLTTSACKVGGGQMELGKVPGAWPGPCAQSPPSCAEAEMEDLTRVGQGSRKLEGWWLKVRQFHGLLVKRFHCARRNSKALSSQILLPAFFVCVAMTVALSVPEIGRAA